MELHLISSGNKDVMVNSDAHFALATPNFDALLDRLNQMKIPFEDTDGKPNKYNVRADGVKQVYFKDPDGYWIEVNNIGEKKD